MIIAIILIFGLLFYLGLLVLGLQKAVATLEGRADACIGDRANIWLRTRASEDRLGELEKRLVRLHDMLEKTSTLLEEADEQNARMSALAERMIAGGVY